MGMMTNVGRRFLLESLRYNTTLLTVDTRALPHGQDELENETTTREERVEGEALQSQIDHHMELNRIWDRIHKNRYGDDGSDFLSIDIYPVVLGVLAKKPLLLFLFLRKEHPQIFGSFYKQRPILRRRRWSERRLKKRRIY